MSIRNEILQSLPIENFFTWWWDNWPGTGFHVWADELLEMEREGIVKIERGRVELVA